MASTTSGISWNSSRYTVAVVLLLCVTAWAPLACATRANTPRESNKLPESLEEIIDPSVALPKGDDVVQEKLLFAVGSQIYTYNESAWATTNVSANLFDFNRKAVGYHYYLANKDEQGGQPTWMTFHPYSLVTAKKIASLNESDSIAWLLLSSTNSEGDRTQLGSTTFVQRLFTKGGLSPASDGSKPGDQFWSNYTSLYSFSTTSPSISCDP